MNEVNLDEVVDLVTFKMGGKSWDVRKPNFGEAMELAKTEQGDDVQNTETMIALLDKLGLPRDVVETMTMEKISIVVKNLIPSGDSKKN
jgi:hypothetical protein